MSRIFSIFILMAINKALLQTIPTRKHKYPYVIALLSDNYRTGTGTLLRREWVLTCAHCVDDITHVQYGNMSIPPELSSTKKKVIKKIQYPEYQATALSNEIGLCRVESVPIKKFGKLSPVEYRSLVGRTVVYAGYGTSLYSDGDDAPRPLQISEGVVTPCDNDKSTGPYICSIPKIIDIKYQDLTEGYTGGPVFSDKKIVGIVSYGLNMLPIGRITAILPYKNWIGDVMAGIIRQ